MQKYSLLRVVHFCGHGAPVFRTVRNMYWYRYRSARPWANDGKSYRRASSSHRRTASKRQTNANNKQTSKPQASKEARGTQPSCSHHIRKAHTALDGAIVVVGSHEAGGNDAGRREKFPHAVGGVRVVVAELPRLLARVVADDYQAERPFGLARGSGGWCAIFRGVKPEQA